MPERLVSEANLKTAAILTGIFLTVWSIIAAIMALIDQTQVATTLIALGLSHWSVPIVLIAIAVMQIGGHAARSRRTLVAADLAGGLACAVSASILAHAAAHGGPVSAIAALNWMFISCIFLIHTVMLRAR